MQPLSNPRGGETGGGEGGLVKGCALRNRANIYVTESCRPMKKVFWVSREKKKSVAERESARFRKGDGWGGRTEVSKGEGGGERGERRRIMKTTMGERALLKLVQFCSRRRARTTTMAVVVAAQYCV